MLKGILFIIAIIITFDIGKALLESWRAEEELDSVVNEVTMEQVTSEDGKTNPAETDSALDDAPVLINLELPQETKDAYQEALEEEVVDENATTNFNTSQQSSKKDKKFSVNAKPIVKFDAEAVEKPRIDGASVGIKVELD